MRKKLRVLMMTLVIAVMFTACGGTNISKMTDDELYDYVKEMYEEGKSDEDIEKWIASIKNTEQRGRAQNVWETYCLLGTHDLTAQTNAQEEKEKEERKNAIDIKSMHFERSEDWDKVGVMFDALNNTWDCYKIQIGDVFVYSGMSAAEFKEQIDNSSLKWKVEGEIPDGDVELNEREEVDAVKVTISAENDPDCPSYCFTFASANDYINRYSDFYDWGIQPFDTDFYCLSSNLYGEDDYFSYYEEYSCYDMSEEDDYGEEY